MSTEITNQQEIQSLRDTELVEEVVETIEHGDVIGNCKWFNKKSR